MAEKAFANQATREHEPSLQSDTLEPQIEQDVLPVGYALPPHLLPRIGGVAREQTLLNLQSAIGNRAVQRTINRSRSAESGDDLAQRIRAASAGGSALDAATRDRLQTGLAADLSAVRVHTDGEADHLARSVESIAFTTGPDIFFRSGSYDPASPQGLRLLAHEAAHTIQQSAGPVAGAPAPGGVSISDPADSFEQAAEQAANSVLSGVASAAPLAAGSAHVQRKVMPEEEEQPLQLKVESGPQQNQAHELMQIADKMEAIRKAVREAGVNPGAPVSPEVKAYRAGYDRAVSRLTVQRRATATAAAAEPAPAASVRAQTRTTLPTLDQAARDLTLWFAMPNPQAHKEQIFQTMLLVRGHSEELQAAFQQSAGRDLNTAIESGLSGNDIIRAKRYLQYGTLRLADKAYFAAKGGGTDEDTLYRLLPQIRANRAQVDADFRADYGADYSSDGRLPDGQTSRIAGVLDNEMSGWELDKGKALLTFGQLRPVDEIRIATNRTGTDEEMLFGALERSNKSTVRQEYQASYEGDLDSLLNSELSGGDKQRATLILAGRFTTLERIRTAVEGWGTDERAIFDALTQASASERSTLLAQFQDTSSEFYQLLRGDLNDEDMQRVGALLRAGEQDTALSKLQQAGALEGSDLVREIKMSAGDKFEKYKADYNNAGSEFGRYVREHTDRGDQGNLEVILNGSVEDRLRWAVAGAGTDEDYIFHVLEKFTDNTSRQALAANQGLMNDLESDLSTRDFNRAKDLLRPSNLGIEERAAATEEQIETERSWLTDLVSNASDALGDENRELQASLDRARADGEIRPEEQAEIGRLQSETSASLDVYKTVRDEIEDTAATVLSTAAAVLIGVLSAGTLSGASAAIIAAQLAQAALVSAVAKVAAMKVAKGDRFDVFGADGAVAFGSGAIDGVLNVVGAGAAERLVGPLFTNVAKEAAGQAASTGFRTVGRELLTQAVEGGISGSASAVFESAANEGTWKHGFLEGLGRVAESGGMAVGMGAAGGVGMHLGTRGYTALSERFSGAATEAVQEGEEALAHTAGGASAPETRLPAGEAEVPSGTRPELITSGPPASPLGAPGAGEGMQLTLHPQHPNVMVDAGIEGFDMDQLLRELDRTPQGSRIADQIRSGDVEIVITREELFSGYAATQVGDELHTTWGGSTEETAASLIHEGTHGLDPDRFVPGMAGEEAASRLSLEGTARAFEYEHRMQAGLKPYDEAERRYRETLERVLMDTGDERAARIAADREMLDAMRADPTRFGVETPAQEAVRMERFRTMPELEEPSPGSFLEPESSMERSLFGDLADEATQPDIRLPPETTPTGGHGPEGAPPALPPNIPGRLGEVTRFEEVERYPARLTALFPNPKQRIAIYDRLESGDLSLREFAGILGEDGAEQVYFRTASGGRYIDHVFLEGENVILRESKNVADFAVTSKIEEQLTKDIALLDKFPEAIVTWRLSGNGEINPGAYDLLEAIQEKTGNRFRMELQDGSAWPARSREPITEPPTQQ